MKLDGRLDRLERALIPRWDLTRLSDAELDELQELLLAVKGGTLDESQRTRLSGLGVRAHAREAWA